MKITGCETLHCGAGWRNFSFLKILTDEGLTGIAEYNESYGSKGLTAVIEALMETIGGRNPCNHEAISQQLYAMTRQAPGGVNQQALAAIAKALIEIQGQALGVPAYDLIRGAGRDGINRGGGRRRCGGPCWSGCGKTGAMSRSETG